MYCRLDIIPLCAFMAHFKSETKIIRATTQINTNNNNDYAYNYITNLCLLESNVHIAAFPASYFFYCGIKWTHVYVATLFLYFNSQYFSLFR